jgi:acetyl esterase/lipase
MHPDLRRQLMRRVTALLVAAAVVLTVGASGPPANAKARATVTSTEMSYGADPLQVVTVSRAPAATGKAVLFLHGGGWSAGGRGSLEAEAAEWAKTGWIAVNASYRLGAHTDDGKLILADALAALQLTRSLPGVDPAKVVVYGESAGGHLATWLGSKYGAQVAAVIALSPVSSVQGAITAGAEPEASDNVVALGAKAQAFFGYSVGTTDAHRYLDRVQHAAVVISTDEWVSPDVHGRTFCTPLGVRCTLIEYPGTLHAGKLADAHPDLLVTLRHWADVQLVNP